jgi:DNA primase
MVDTTHVDIMAHVPTRLKKVASTGGGEYHGPCPMCGGTDRFAVQPNYDYPRWFCRECNKSWSDAIELMQRLHGDDFVQACQRLNIRLDKKKSSWPAPRRAPAAVPAVDAPAISDSAYIDMATKFVDWAWRNLHSGDYRDVQYNYLLEQRIIGDDITFLHMVGYNPSWKTWDWGKTRVKVAPGIVFPYLESFDGPPRRINIRRMDGDPKYIQIKGGANWLYNAWQIKSKSTVILCESEIDALSVSQMVVHHAVVPVATGSAQACRLARWIALLSTARRVLVAFDNDSAGEAAARWWIDTLPNAARLQPTRHDVNDMLKHGHDFKQWIAKGLKS